MSVENIITKTKCPFARGAKIEKVTINSRNLPTAIKNLREPILEFFTKKAKNGYDALTFIFEDHNFGNSIEKLTINTKKFYVALATEFPELQIPIEIDDYNQVSWPEIACEKFFMVSFAPCYSKDSSRYNHEDPRTFFFLQPASSFERHAHDGNAVTDEFREKIRKLFAKSGQPYDSEISSLQNEWVKLVHPLKLGDEIIKWWEVKE